MKIAVIGVGSVGGVLGSRWAKCGHKVTFGALDPESAAVGKLISASGANATAKNVRQAMAEGDVVLLAVPWKAARQVVEDAESLSGKIIIDCINPTNSDLSGLEIGHNTSAAEEIASWVPEARVVKAFNTTGVGSMVNAIYRGEKASVFICGDNSKAKANVTQLAQELDFEVIDAGPLSSARYLEPFAMLSIQLAVHQGFVSDFAFKVITR